MDCSAKSAVKTLGDLKVTKPGRLKENFRSGWWRWMSALRAFSTPAWHTVKRKRWSERLTFGDDVGVTDESVEADCHHTTIVRDKSRKRLIAFEINARYDNICYIISQNCSNALWLQSGEKSTFGLKRPLFVTNLNFFWIDDGRLSNKL